MAEAASDVSVDTAPPPEFRTDWLLRGGATIGLGQLVFGADGTLYSLGDYSGAYAFPDSAWPFSPYGTPFVTRRRADGGSVYGVALGDGVARLDAFCLAVGPTGEAFVGGAVDAPGASPDTIQRSALLTKLRPDGSVAWSKSFPSSGAQPAPIIAVSARADGSALVLGVFEKTLSFDVELVAPAPGGAFIGVVDADGKPIWSKMIGGERVVEDAAGNIYLAGYFRGTRDFGGGPLTATRDRDVVVVSLDHTGAFRWAKRFDGTNTKRYGIELVVDEARRRVLVASTFDATFAWGASTWSARSGSADVAVYALDFDGAAATACSSDRTSRTCQSPSRSAATVDRSWRWGRGTWSFPAVRA